MLHDEKGYTLKIRMTEENEELFTPKSLKGDLLSLKRNPENLNQLYGSLSLM